MEQDFNVIFNCLKSIFLCFLLSLTYLASLHVWNSPYSRWVLSKRFFFKDFSPKPNRISVQTDWTTYVSRPSNRTAHPSSITVHRFIGTTEKREQILPWEPKSRTSHPNLKFIIFTLTLLVVIKKIWTLRLKLIVFIKTLKLCHTSLLIS